MKRLAALGGLLTLLLPLCACGRGGTVREGLLYEASGLSLDTVVMTVDGQSVTAERYLYWLAQACDDISACYAAENMEPDWDALLGTQTLVEYAAEQARSTAVLYAEVEAWAERYGCSVTAEERTAIQQEWQEAAAAAGGQEAYDAQLARMGVSQDFADTLSEDYYLYAQLYALAQTEGSDLCPTKTELTTWAQAQSMITLRTLLLSTEMIADGDQTALSARQTTAENLRTQLQLHEDPDQAFAALGAQVGAEEANWTAAPGESGLPVSVEAAAWSLKEGELSRVVETEEGYWLVLRLPLDQEAVTAAWFDNRLQAAADAADVECTEVLEKLDPAAFYKNLTALRQELPPAGDTAATVGEGTTSSEEENSSSEEAAGSAPAGEVINLPDQNNQTI